MKHAVPVVCLKEISPKAQRKIQQDAMRGKWYNLVRLQDIPEFAAWLTDDSTRKNRCCPAEYSTDSNGYPLFCLAGKM